MPFARRYDHARIRRLAARGLGPTAIAREVGCTIGHASLVARGKLPTHYRLLPDDELESALAKHRRQIAAIEAEIARRLARR